jgi:hypothetical protein
MGHVVAENVEHVDPIKFVYGADVAQKQMVKPSISFV